jgi:hypothetical protein
MAIPSCKICDQPAQFAFRKKILRKHDVAFFRCAECGFLQTEEPFWLAEAYASPLSPLDVYLIARPLGLGEVTKNVILNYFDNTKKFLDYGGGAGVFTRHMRDLGFDFYRQDKYANNLFSRFFDVNDLPREEQKFELVTCFEVLEHLAHPLHEFAEMFAYGSNVLCGTQVQPCVALQDLAAWDYLGELHGQHVSFYTTRSMEVIARRFGCNYYSDGVGLHLFTSKKIANFTFQGSMRRKAYDFLRKRLARLGSGNALLAVNEPLTCADAAFVAAKIEADRN